MYQIKSRIWVEGPEGIFLGEGRIQLLQTIDEEGSLSKAAKKMNMSYKKAWNLVDAMNKSANQPVVITATGGSGGGGTRVTTFGKEKIAAFQTIKSKCWEFLDQLNLEFNQS